MCTGVPVPPLAFCDLTYLRQGHEWISPSCDERGSSTRDGVMLYVVEDMATDGLMDGWVGGWMGVEVLTKSVDSVYA